MLKLNTLTLLLSLFLLKLVLGLLLCELILPLLLLYGSLYFSLCLLCRKLCFFCFGLYAALFIFLYALFGVAYLLSCSQYFYYLKLFLWCLHPVYRLFLYLLHVER